MACAIVAFVLSMLCLFAGHKPGFMEEYHIVTVWPPSPRGLSNTNISALAQHLYPWAQPDPDSYDVNRTFGDCHLDRFLL